MVLFRLSSLDDTNIFVSAKTEELAYKITQETLNEISNYMNCNKLHVNPDKSCYIYNAFKNHSKTKENENSTRFELNISNTPLPKVDQTKFLGVAIDDS